jgi:hypothetical protein
MPPKTNRSTGPSRGLVLLAVFAAIPIALRLFSRSRHETNDARSFAQDAHSFQEEARRLAEAASARTPVVAPTKAIAWTVPHGPPPPIEKEFAGTWVASVGELATRTAHMSRSKAIKAEGAKTVGDLAEAIEKGESLKTNCIWLELYDNRKGVRYECGIINGTPSALSLANPLTGEKVNSQVNLEWYLDAASREIRIRYDDDMRVPAVDPQTKKLRELSFRHWVLKLEKAVGDNIEVQESIPEHDYELPARHVYEFFAGKFVDDEK